MFNIKFSNDPKFSLTTSELISGLSIVPASINTEIFASEIVRRVNFNLKNIYKDQSNVRYYMIVKTADWVIALDDFADQEEVDIASRNNIIIPIDLQISLIGYGLKSTEIIIEIHRESTGFQSIGTNRNDQFASLQMAKGIPLRTVKIPVNINVIEDEAILSEDLNISHLQGNPLPKKPLILENVDGEVSIEIAGMLSIESANIVSQSYDDENDMRYYTLSSAEDVYVKLHRETLGIYSFPIVIITEHSVRTVVCQVNVESEYRYTSSVDSLRFTSVTGVSEAEAKHIILTGVGDFEVVGPTWLNISPASGNETTEIKVQPWFSENLGANSFQDNILIFLNEVHYITIPVTYDVSRMALIRNRTLYFTKDNLISEFYGDNNVNTAVVIDTYADTRREKELLKAHNNNRSLFDFGYHIENMLEAPDFDSLIENNRMVYNYKNISRVNISVASVNRVSGEVEFSRQYLNQKYISGHSPKENYNNLLGILDRKALPQRVYPNSYIIINFFADNITSNIITTHAGEFPVREIVQNEMDIFGVKKIISENSGGEINVSLEYQSSGETFSLSKKYISFPTPIYPVYHILYRTEYDTIGCFAIGGKVSISDELEGVDIDVFERYRRKRKRIDILNTSELIINTGHALLTDRDVVLDIMKSKQAWFDNGVNKIPMNPSDYSETIDNATGLYSATLNFIVNTDDIQDYTPAI